VCVYCCGGCSHCLLCTAAPVIASAAQAICVAVLPVVCRVLLCVCVCVCVTGLPSAAANTPTNISSCSRTLHACDTPSVISYKLQCYLESGR
jgi:hypothetical protein